MKLTLVRHTSLDIAPNICYGQSDVDVSAQFDVEQQALQNKLSKFKFDAIYASPLQRCHKLAKALCEDASLGLWLGIQRARFNRRYSGDRITPYSG